MSVREAQLKIDSAEFTEWCAYSNINPFYINKTEYMLAVVSAILVNVNRKKNAKAMKPEDFLPTYTAKNQYDSADEMYIKLRALVRGNNK